MSINSVSKRISFLFRILQRGKNRTTVGTNLKNPRTHSHTLQPANLTSMTRQNQQLTCTYKLQLRRPRRTSNYYACGCQKDGGPAPSPPPPPHLFGSRVRAAATPPRHLPTPTPTRAPRRTSLFRNVSISLPKSIRILVFWLVRGIFGNAVGGERG